MRRRTRLLALFGMLAVIVLASVLLYGAGVDPLLVVLLGQLAIAALVLFAFPFYLLPALAERIERRPGRIPAVDDAVLVYRYGPAVTAVLDPIERAGLQPVIIESDEAVARDLRGRGRRVVLHHRGSNGDGPLDGLDLGPVRAIVANGGDRANATLTLAARRAGFEGEILAIAEEAQHRKPLALAGANRVFAPRQVLAAALAARASERVSPRIVGAQSLGRRLVLSEVKIGARSPLAGESLKGADVGRRHGVNVIGLWRYGELYTPVDSENVIDPQTILVVAGSHESVTRFRQACAATDQQLAGSAFERRFVVAGHGEVGRTVTQILRGAGEQVITVDPRGGDGIDLPADISDPRVLESSAVSDARAVIVALGGDDAALLATLAIAQQLPHLPILARVDHADSVERVRRAGADYALSISQVAAQLLVARLLGRESILIHPALEVLKVSSENLLGHHPAELATRERTGASVVAIARGDEVIAALEPAFTFAEGDVVYVGGGAQALQAFLAAFPAPPERHAPRAVSAAGDSGVRPIDAP
jgi:Trk K+ transport system NAD-binding subunit